MAMIVIPRRVPWRRQPPGPREINPKYKDNLSLLFDPRRRDWTGLSNTTYGTNERGAALDINNADSAYAYYDKAQATGAISVLAVTRIVALTGTTFQGSAGDNGIVIYSTRNIGSNISPTLVVTNESWAGSSMRLWFGKSTDSIANGKANSTIISAGYYVLIGVMSASAVERIYVNGFQNATTYDTFGSFSTAWSGTRHYLGHENQWPTAANDDGLQQISLLARWDRELTDAEALELSSNPWQIFAPRTQRIFIPISGTKTATFVLNDKDGNAVANATGIRAAWFDQMPGSSMAAPTDVSAIETSDGSGNHTINIPNSTLTSGQTGYYAISNSDGTIATNHLQGGGPAKVD